MKMNYQLNPDWYRAKYNLASEYLSWAQTGKEAKLKKRLDKAEKCVVELLEQIATTLGHKPWGRRACDPELRALRSFIAADVRPNAKLLRARIEIARQPAQGPDGEGEAATPTIESSASVVQTAEEEGADTSELNYSIARLYAQTGDLDPAREYLDAAVVKADPSEWPVLANRMARDPVLSEVEPPSASAVGFAPLLELAREEVGE
jgi:tetratricopeptide (TPR) repeat protein